MDLAESSALVGRVGSGGRPMKKLEGLRVDQEFCDWREVGEYKENV